jgi:hypothetical protein
LQLYPYSYATKAARTGAIFVRAAVTGTAGKDLIRLHGKNPDHVPGLSEEDMRTGLELSEYLLHVAKMTPEALPFFLGMGGRNSKRVHTPALEAAARGSPVSTASV